MASKIFSTSKKSKYFQFIDSNAVISQVISYNGSIIPLPKEWAIKKVHVLFNDGLKQEFYVKDNGNICYVSVAKIYLGTDVQVSLTISTKKDKDSRRSDTLGKMAIGTMYLTLSIYLFAIAFQLT